MHTVTWNWFITLPSVSGFRRARACRSNINQPVPENSKHEISRKHEHVCHGISGTTICMNGKVSRLLIFLVQFAYRFLVFAIIVVLDFIVNFEWKIASLQFWMENCPQAGGARERCQSDCGQSLDEWQGVAATIASVNFLSSICLPISRFRNYSRAWLHCIFSGWLVCQSDCGQQDLHVGLVDFSFSQL